MYLNDHPLEWHILDGICRITISRFYRDRELYNALRSVIFPELLEIVRREGDKIISCWCIGAASGEEPYSLGILWQYSGLGEQGAEISVVATEVDPYMINRARTGCYPAGSLRELPLSIKKRAFRLQEGQYCLKDLYKKQVRFLQQDIRDALPDETFHLILCRNLVFTYFSDELQKATAWRILQRLKGGGGLVLGSHEKLPVSLPDLMPWLPKQKIYRRKL